jgi:hypothetical protein
MLTVRLFANNLNQEHICGFISNVCACVCVILFWQYHFGGILIINCNVITVLFLSEVLEVHINFILHGVCEFRSYSPFLYDKRDSSYISTEINVMVHSEVCVHSESHPGQCQVIHHIDISGGDRGLSSNSALTWLIDKQILICFFIAIPSSLTCSLSFLVKCVCDTLKKLPAQHFIVYVSVGHWE